MPLEVIIIERNAEGQLVDAQGNIYNEQHQRLDAAGYVVPVQIEQQFYASNSTFRPPPFARELMMCQLILDDQQRIRDELNAKKWDFEVEEAPVKQVSSFEMMAQRILDDQQRICSELKKDIAEIKSRSYNTESVAAEPVILEEVEREFEDQNDTIYETVNTCLVKMPLESEECEVSPTIPHEPKRELLHSELPELVHELPNPESKPPKKCEPEVLAVFNLEENYELIEIFEKATTPGNCHKRKVLNATLQPPLKRIRAHPEAIVAISIAAYLVDPEDIHAVYSKGPRPP